MCAQNGASSFKTFLIGWVRRVNLERCRSSFVSLICLGITTSIVARWQSYYAAGKVRGSLDQTSAHQMSRAENVSIPKRRYFDPEARCHRLVWEPGAPLTDHTTRPSDQFAIAVALKGLQNKVTTVIKAVKDIRQFSDRTVLILVSRKVASDVEINSLRKLSAELVDVSVMTFDIQFNVSVRSTGYDVDEYMKLEVLNMSFKKVLVIDSDKALQKSPEILFRCEADFMYTSKRFELVDTDMFVVTPNRRMYAHMLKTFEIISTPVERRNNELLCLDWPRRGRCAELLDEDRLGKFLHYYFVQHADMHENHFIRVRELNPCIWNVNSSQNCRDDWSAHGKPYIVSSSSNFSTTFVNGALIQAFPVKKVCRADFWILGTRKGGTTALYTSMAQHPKLTGLNIRGRPQDGEIFVPIQRLDAYNSVFRNVAKNSIAGDSAVHRLVTNARAIPATCGQKYTRFLILLRDPIERCHSQMLMRSRLGTNGMTDKSNISEAITEDLRLYRSIEPDLKNEIDAPYPELDLRLPANNCITAGLYYLQLKRWFFHSSVRSFLIFFNEDFQKSTLQVVRAALNFVGVDAEDCNTFAVKEEKLTSNSRKNLDLSPHQLITPLLRRELEHLFAPYNVLLKNLIGRVPWRYVVQDD